jgi:hypothetical protein
MSSKTTNRVIQIALLLTWIIIVVLRTPRSLALKVAFTRSTLISLHM